jgi:hypothetical protein
LVPKVGGISADSMTPQPAARPGADEDDPAALLERLREDLDADHDPILLAVDGGEHLAVLGEHFFDDVAGRLLVNRQRGRVDGFGRKGLPLRTRRHAWNDLANKPRIVS